MRKVSNVLNSIAESSVYPFGGVKNRVGTTGGTEFHEIVVSDVLQSMYKFMIAAGITPNGQPDNNTNGYQIFEAIKKVLDPPGTIKEWYGDLTTICDSTGLGKGNWIGWALINGQNGTPAAAGKFFVNYDATDSDYNAMGKTGGAKDIGLTESNMPTHNHPIDGDGSHHHNYDKPDGATYTTATSGTQVPVYTTVSVATSDVAEHNHGGATGSVGSGEHFENRPPFFTVAFLIKL